jgi:hypothetical protein
MKRDNRRFQPGSAVYVCVVCKKRTRDTRGDYADPTMCARCDDMALAANYITDNGLTRAEARKHAEAIAMQADGKPLTEEEWKRMQWAIRE